MLDYETSYKLSKYIASIISPLWEILASIIWTQSIRCNNHSRRGRAFGKFSFFINVHIGEVVQAIQAKHRVDDGLTERIPDMVADLLDRFLTSTYNS